MTRLWPLLLLPVLAQSPALQTPAPDRAGAAWRGFTPWSSGVIRGRDGYMQQARPGPLSDEDRAAVLALRESVWRNWFGGDTASLRRVLPPELITLSQDEFGTLESTLAASRAFAESGGKLMRLVFPRTDFQAYGATVILYTSYEMDLATGGVTHTERGLGTEVFVRQADGSWLHTGWQLAPVAR